MVKMQESQVLTDYLQYLEARGIYHWRNNTGAVRIAPGRYLRFGKAGSADIIGACRKVGFWQWKQELKVAAYHLNKKTFLDKIRGLGGIALFVQEWCELDEALREAGYAMNDGPLFR
jgi:hypothetical protein